MNVRSAGEQCDSWHGDDRRVEHPARHAPLANPHPRPDKLAENLPPGATQLRGPGRRADISHPTKQAITQAITRAFAQPAESLRVLVRGFAPALSGPGA
jgi:hypothetical protein